MTIMKPHAKSKWGHSYRSWHIPLSEDRVKLNEAVYDMHAMSWNNLSLPLILKLGEMPDTDRFFKPLTLMERDCLHILLGRGMLAKDEAFVCGFLMGSTGNVRFSEEKLLSLMSNYLSNPDDLEVFSDGVLLGMSSHCKALDQIDFRRYMTETLSAVRLKLGINTGLLAAYYETEAEKYGYAMESRRLVH